MTALVVLGLVSAGLAVVCYLTDRRPPAEPERYPQASHVHVLDDQEPTA